MTNEERLERIGFLFTQRQLTKSKAFDREIELLLAEVFDELAAQDYSESKQTRAYLFQYSDEHNELLFGTLYLLLQKQLKAISQLQLVPVKQKLEGIDDRTEIESLLEQILESNLTKGSNIRLTNKINIDSSVSKDHLLQLFSAIVLTVQAGMESYFNLERTELNGIVLSLTVARQLALITDRVDLFYGTLGILAERLNLSQDFQLSRDFSEEVLFTSFVDNRTDWG